jgi:hypothetical protein
MRCIKVKTPLLISTCLLLSTIGCLRVSPKMPKVVASPTSIFYSPSQFDNDVASYRASVSSGNLAAAATQRNQIVYRILAQIDEAYGGFELHLSTTRAGYQTGAAAVNLGLTAAATLVGASDIKTILAATSTAFQGAQTSFDKNFFEQKTTEALVSQMRASRKTLQAQIITNLSTRNPTSYPLEAAWTDVIAYYYAGTLPSALVAIASKAGSDDVKAGQSLADAKTLAVFTEAGAQTAISIRSAYTQLSRDLGSSDPGAVSAAEESLRQILTKAGISFDPSSKGDALLATLKNAMIAASGSPVESDKLGAAVQAVMKRN